MPPSRRWVDVTERAIYLRSIPVAAELPQSVRHAVAHSLVERELEVGERALEKGKPVRALELVTSGCLRLENGDRFLGDIRPPQTVGFLNILARADAAYDAVATEPVHALELSADRFFELMEDHYPLLVATLRYFAQRLLYEMQELPQEALGFAPIEFPMPVPARPLDLVERIFFLRCLTTYKKTNLGALTILAEHMSEVRVGPDTRLFSIGERSDFTLFLLSGTVVCDAADGRSFQYGPGTAVGGVEALANQDRWYEARTRTPIVALRGRADALVSLMEDDFELGCDFITMLAKSLLGMMAAKASRGQAMSGDKRDVSNLGKVLVGA